MIVQMIQQNDLPRSQHLLDSNFLSIREVQSINMIYFQGQPVFYLSGSTLMINTGVLSAPPVVIGHPSEYGQSPQTSYNSHPQHVQQYGHSQGAPPPGYSQSTGYAQVPGYGQHPTSYAHVPPPGYPQQHAPIPFATAVVAGGVTPSQTGQVFLPLRPAYSCASQYVVPSDVVPGSQVQVVSPSGSYVIISIPKEASPGDAIQYLY
jgi:hypothetical protein